MECWIGNPKLTKQDDEPFYSDLLVYTYVYVCSSVALFIDCISSIYKYVYSLFEISWPD